MDADFSVIHLDPVDDRPEPGPAEGRLADERVLAHERHERRNLRLRDARLGAHLADGAVEGRLRDVALGLDRREAVLERRIVGVGYAVLDGLIETAKTALGFCQLAAQGGEPAGMVGLPAGLAVHEPAQQVPDPLDRQQLVAKAVGDNAVEPLHGHGTAFARRLALLRCRRADVIAITPRLARAQRHAAAAGRAGGNAGEQRRAGHDARRHDAWIALLELRLHRIERRRRNDRLDLDRDELARGLGLARLRIHPVELGLALIDRVGDELMQRADAPPRAAAGPVAALIKPARGGLDAHRTACAIALAQKTKDETDGLGLDRIDGEALLGLGPALLGGDYRIAERRRGPIPETLPGILLHGAQDMLRVFLRLVLVEQREDLTDHDAHRVVAEILRHGHEPHARLAQAAHVILQCEVVARKAAERMHHHDVERRAAVGCNVEQALQLRAIVVGAGKARIDELGRDRPAAGFTERKSLTALVGNRQVALGLTAGRDAQIERRALRRFLLGSRSRGGHCSPLFP